MIKPKIFWITGLSGAGKTTVSKAVKTSLKDRGLDFWLLDGDVLRDGLNKDLGFSMAHRTENVRRAAEVAKLFLNHNISVICTFISPTIEIRNMAKTIIGEDHFKEVFVNTPLSVCEARDVKGLYKKARAGEIKAFSGIDSVFENPENPGLILDCSTATIHESAKKLESYILNSIHE